MFTDTAQNIWGSCWRWLAWAVCVFLGDKNSHLLSPKSLPALPHSVSGAQDLVPGFELSGCVQCTEEQQSVPVGSTAQLVGQKRGSGLVT